jgi:hypothetical protein
MRVGEKLQQTADISEGGTATLEIESTKDWPEPNVPQDFETALATAPQKIQDLWNDITPMARWEWVRWVEATQNPDTGPSFPASHLRGVSWEPDASLSRSPRRSQLGR